ncbi:MAG: hypothetical protein R2746_04765 [Acidimicrobiales bacterium]
MIVGLNVLPGGPGHHHVRVGLLRHLDLHGSRRRRRAALVRRAVPDAARDRVPAARLYFARYALSEAEATETALGIWRDINRRSLVANIKPTRDRATVVLHKGPDHRVTQVRLRRT